MSILKDQKREERRKEKRDKKPWKYQQMLLLKSPLTNRNL
jgi:hypothetical protein